MARKNEIDKCRVVFEHILTKYTIYEEVTIFVPEFK